MCSAYRARQTDITNISTGNSVFDSGISAILCTGDTSSHSFGGDVGDPWWQLINPPDVLIFSVEAWDGEGFIAPPALDLGADMLSILYTSPYNQLVNNGTIDIQTYGSGAYTINFVQLPGAQPKSTLSANINNDGCVDMNDLKEMCDQ